MKALAVFFGFGEYISRICSWILASYFGESYLIWIVVSVDFICGFIAEIRKYGEKRLLSFFDFLFCFRMHDPYLFYGSKFDSQRYMNLKEIERFIL